MLEQGAVHFGIIRDQSGLIIIYKSLEEVSKTQILSS